MRSLPLLVSRHQFRIGLQLFFARVFPLTTRRDDVHNLPPYLLRDIGLNERRAPDWERLTR